MVAAVALLAMGVLTGCSKDEILGTYNYAIQAAGDAQLTGHWSLEEKENMAWITTQAPILPIMRIFRNRVSLWGDFH